MSNGVGGSGTGAKYFDSKINDRCPRSRDFVKKREFAREYGKLKLQETFLEKSANSAVSNLKVDPRLDHRIAEEQLEISTTRETELRPLIESTVDIVRQVRTIKGLLSDAEAIGTMDVDECKSKLLWLTKRMKEFEGETCLEGLKAREESLESDLRDFERKMVGRKPASCSTRRVNEGRMLSNRNEAIDDFAKLICRTGHTENWPDEDHALFLKVRKKCDTIPRLVEEMRDRCPDLTTERIVNHEAWYKQYLTLLDERKRNIEAWRRTKKMEQSRHTEAEKEAESTSILDSDRVLIEVKSKSASKSKRKEPKSSDERKSVVQKRRMIEEWRREKERKLHMDEEQKKRLEEQRAEEEKKRREMRREEMRIKLNEYRNDKAKKIRDDDRSKSVPNLRNGPTPLTKSDSLRLIQSFREQDEEFVRKKLRSLKVSRKDHGTDANERPMPWKSVRPRDYSSLFASTIGWEEKCKPEPKMDKSFGEVMFVKNIPKLSSISRWKSQNTMS